MTTDLTVPDTANQPNVELAYRVLDHIDAHPESWIQRHWWIDKAGCGAAGCFAGWTCALSGDVIEHGLVGGKHVADRAAELLGFEGEDDLDSRLGDLDPDEESTPFYGANRRADLGRIVETLFGPRPERAS